MMRCASGSQTSSMLYLCSGKPRNAHRGMHVVMACCDIITVSLTSHTSAHCSALRSLIPETTRSHPRVGRMHHNIEQIFFFFFKEENPTGTAHRRNHVCSKTSPPL